MKQVFPFFLILFWFTHVWANDLSDNQITYRNDAGKSLQLRVFQPENWAAAQTNTALIFFPNANASNSDAKQFDDHCSHVAAKGAVAICVDYLPNAELQTSPRQAVKNGKSAIRWVRQHATKLGVDPQKIIAVGAAGGAQVALGTAVLNQLNHEDDPASASARPNAIIVMDACVTNPPEGITPEQWEALAIDKYLKADTPPLLMIHGELNKQEPAQAAQAFQNKMNPQGLHCDLLLFDGQSEGFFAKELYQDVLAEMEFFLISFGFLTGCLTL